MTLKLINDSNNFEKMRGDEYFEDKVLDEQIYCINVSDQISHRNNLILEKIINDRYMAPIRPAVPIIKREMKLVLDNPKLFNCPPRRLAYSERNKLQILLDDYLEKGYIRAGVRVTHCSSKKQNR